MGCFPALGATQNPQAKSFQLYFEMALLVYAEISLGAAGCSKVRRPVGKSWLKSHAWWEKRWPWTWAGHKVSPGWMWKVRDGQESMSTVTPEWMEVGLLGWAAWAGGRAG